ncbi:MAG: Excinuclease ABC subunit C [Parcubacteria group bacterium LiPW_41]|nr:MAG: Excinuclease ABC subunit C [Parcubacteria group bacterium LiPW_41]
MSSVANKKGLYKDISENPGVYIMKDTEGEILYIGKAGNLKRRVSSYFLRPNNVRIETMVSHIQSIETRETDSALEALILESALIKKYQPPFNIREKDDTSFLFVVVTCEQFPRVLLVRGKDLGAVKGIQFGPYVSSSSIREALRILRKIFQWSVHEPERVGTYKKPCFEYEIGLCPGTCVGSVDGNEYKKTIKKLVLFFEGKKDLIIAELEKEMKTASKQLEFERANKLKKQIFALTHIRDTALISSESFEIRNSKFEISATRVEGYDISNISGTSAVGSMVVFVNGVPAKNQYKKFKIKTVEGPNDVRMLREVLMRRFKHTEWEFPQCILIDGGKPQVNEAKEVLKEINISIPIVGIAKGEKRRKNEFIGAIPKGIEDKTLISVRDEAHRFAIKYHKEVRKKATFS